MDESSGQAPVVITGSGGVRLPGFAAPPPATAGEQGQEAGQ